MKTPATSGSALSNKGPSRGVGRNRWARFWIALLAVGCQPQNEAEPAIDRGPETAVAEPGVAVEPARTLYPRTLLAVPDTTPESEWLNVVLDMRYDAASGTLFTLDRMAGRVAEVDTLGTLVHLYGAGRGQGPHEVRDLTDYSFSPSSVAFLDRGNTKVMVYPRRESRPIPFPVPSAYRSIALAPDETILLAPGMGAHAVDVYAAAGDLAGDVVGGIGAFEDLPVRCMPDEDCERKRRLCMGCVVRVVAGAVLVMNAEEDLLTVFGAEGRPTRSLDLRARIPQLRAWIGRTNPCWRARRNVWTRAGAAGPWP